jgi:release factor glutamine methyltransferase
MLVDIALGFISDQCTVLDLCAGSGCVGLSVAHHCPNAQVHLLELSDEALPYLRQNAEKYPNAHVHQADIFNAEFLVQTADLILTNPPYIPTQEIATLSEEVRREPSMALDGGKDGLDFYRAIADTWLPKLPPGGMLAAECGEGQAEAVAGLFSPLQTEIMHDFNHIPRIVIARA